MTLDDCNSAEPSVRGHICFKVPSPTVLSNASLQFVRHRCISGRKEYLGISQKPLFDDFQSTGDPIPGLFETSVQIDQVVRDVLELQRFVQVPALAERPAVLVQGMGTGT